MAFLDSLRIRGTHICQRLTHWMCCQIDHSWCLPVVRVSLWCTALPSVFAHGSEHRKDSELVNGNNCQKTAEEDDQKPDHLQCLHGSSSVSRGLDAFTCQSMHQRRKLGSAPEVYSVRDAYRRCPIRVVQPRPVPAFGALSPDVVGLP